jgi:hypothetical protein
MSSVSAFFEPTQCVESLERGRTYPKRAVVSYLTGKPINLCLRKDGTSLKECAELTDLIEHFGLLKLGPPHAVRFLGQHIIEAEIRRNTNSRMESTYCRINSKQLIATDESKKNESVDSPEEGRH